MGYAQTGTAALGGIIGGIGDIVGAAGYHQPHLQDASGMELRLRQLANSQLLGGGQQLLGATALYNQMAPILMGQLPGMHYVPGQTPGQDQGGDSSQGPGDSYQQALQNLQQRQNAQLQAKALTQQWKQMQPGADRKALGQQRKQLQKQLKGMLPAQQLQQDAYRQGAQPGSFDVRQGQPAPTVQSSLGDINTLMGNGGGGGGLDDFLAQYRGAGGY